MLRAADGTFAPGKRRRMGANDVACAANLPCGHAACQGPTRAAAFAAGAQAVLAVHNAQLRAIEDALVAQGQSQYDAVVRATASAWETSDGTKVPGLRAWAAVRQDQASRLAQSAHRYAVPHRRQTSAAAALKAAHAQGRCGLCGQQESAFGCARNACRACCETAACAADDGLQCGHPRHRLGARGQVSSVHSLLTRNHEAVAWSMAAWLEECAAEQRGIGAYMSDTCRAAVLRGTLWVDGGNPHGATTTEVAATVHDDERLLMHGTLSQLKQMAFHRVAVLKGGCGIANLKKLVAPVLRVLIDAGLWGAHTTDPWARLQVVVTEFVADMEALAHAISKTTSTGMCSPFGHWCRSRTNVPGQQQIGNWSLADEEHQAPVHQYGHWMRVWAEKVEPARRAAGGDARVQYSQSSGVGAQRPWLYAFKLRVVRTSPSKWAAFFSREHHIGLQVAVVPDGLRVGKQTVAVEWSGGGAPARAGGVTTVVDVENGVGGAVTLSNGQICLNPPAISAPMAAPASAHAYQAPDLASEPESSDFDVLTVTAAERDFIFRLLDDLWMMPGPLHSTAGMIKAWRDTAAELAVCNGNFGAGGIEMRRAWCAHGHKMFFKQHWHTYDLRHALAMVVAEHIGAVPEDADRVPMRLLCPPMHMITAQLLAEVGWHWRHNPEVGLLPVEHCDPGDAWAPGITKLAGIVAVVQLWYLSQRVYADSMGYGLHAFSLVPAMTATMARLPVLFTRDEERFEADFGDQTARHKCGAADVLARVEQDEFVNGQFRQRWHRGRAAHKSAYARRMQCASAAQTLPYPMVPAEFAAGGADVQGFAWRTLQTQTASIMHDAGLAWERHHDCLVPVPRGEAGMAMRERIVHLCEETRRSMRALLAPAAVNVAYAKKGRPETWQDGFAMLQDHSAPTETRQCRARRFGAILACVQTRNAAGLLRCYGDAPWQRSTYGSLQRARPEDRVLHAYNQWREEAGETEEATELPSLKKLRNLAGHLQVTSIGSKATRKQVVAAIHAIVSGSGQSADAELEDDMQIGDSDNGHDDAGA